MSTDELIYLEVSTEDEGAQIFVIDRTFRLVARGVGRLEAQLSPGIYSIKVQVGSEAREEHIVLNPGDRRVTKILEPLKFTSSMPLANTAKTHEYHEAAAWNECNKLHAQMGTGSAIFIFVRDWHSEDSITQHSNLHPARGLMLRRPNGDDMLSFEEMSTYNDSASDPWAACNVEVDPGLYILRLTLSSGAHLEQTVVASPGWQTQIFLLQRSYGPNPDDIQADLLDASILLLQYPHSDPPSDHEMRLVELLRIGLSEERRVLSDEIQRTILEAQVANPMLGIFGAHLLLLEKEPDLQLLATIINNLRQLLGSHPDVEALSLALEHDDSSYIFEIPPMLRRSWWYVVTATVTKPEIVPAGSLAAAESHRLGAGELWHQWLIPQTAPSRTERTTTSRKKREFTPTEKIIMNQMAPPPQTDESPLPAFTPMAFGPALDRGTSDEAIVGGQVPTLNEEDMAELVQSLGLPRAVIEEMASELKDEL